jgi:UDPglucose 6-dehydrogenase
MAGVFAEAGYPVIGIDVNDALIVKVNAGEVPYVEPLLDIVLAGARGRLHATNDYHEAVLQSDTTFIVVATPTQPDGTYGNEQLSAALTSIAHVLREKDTKHRIVISCTVMPGTIDREMIPLVERESGKKLGEGFSIAYNPEFIAMGNVIRIFTEPDFVLVGESEPEIGEELARIYANICPNDPPVSRMNIINAEVAKISLNCFVTTKITYANMLAELCEALPGADVDTVTQAIGQDKRIGPKVLKGGLGFGGPCFPRDNRAFVRLARDHNVNADLANQTHETNQWQIERLRRWVGGELQSGATVAILGLAYRPDTPLVEESQALQLAAHLVDGGFNVLVHDPVALPNARDILGDRMDYVEDPVAALKGADAVVVTMMDKVYRELTTGDFASVMNPGAHLFDLWRMYAGQDMNGLTYHPLGVGPKVKEGA